MTLLAWILPLSAHAFPVEVRTVALPAIADGVDVSALGDGPHLTVIHAGGVDDIDPMTGAVRAHWPHTGTSLLLRQAGGAPQLVACSADGLSFGPPTAAALAALSDAPCAAVARHDGGFVALLDSAWWYADDGAGDLADPVDLDIAAIGDPVYASAPGAFALAAAGDGVVQVWDAQGSYTVGLSGEISGLAAVGDRFYAGLYDSRLIGLPNEGTLLAEVPGVLASGDLDGDNLPDLVVTYPFAGQLGVRSGDGADEVNVLAPWSARDLAIGDLDADGCDEVVVLDPAAAQAYIVEAVTCEGAAVDDADGDGYNALNDCDDLNATVHPGATDVCDGVDQDCDGIIDDGDVQIVGPNAAVEGSPAQWSADLGGCAEGDVVWSGTLTLADTAPVEWTGEHCALSGDGATVTCTFPDQGTLALIATVTLDEGARTTTRDIPIANEAPQLVVPDDWYDQGTVNPSRHELTLDLDPGQTFYAQLGADDVPGDTVTFRIEGPGYARVTASGQIVVEGDDVPFYSARPLLILTDEDGGEDRWSLIVNGGGGYDTGWNDTGWWYDTGGDTNLSDLSCSGCCCGIGVMPLFALFLPWIRRRQHP